jgi:SAM-dependent methyltransferase
MGIDTGFLDRIDEIGRRLGLFPGGSVLILGDCKFHTPWSCGNNLEDLSYFKRLFGLIRVETVDVAGRPSIRRDLQKPLPPELTNQFDLIIDAGTLFWCFDIAAVLENCLSMLKDQGAMIHVCALTGHFGRGYYNIHPKLFRDFYEQNGFAMLSTEVRVHKQVSRLANLQRKLMEWRGRSVGDYQAIRKDALFLKNADFVSMEFTEQIATESPMLPNDALFLCAATRRERMAFVRPIP